MWIKYFMKSSFVIFMLMYLLVFAGLAHSMEVERDSLGNTQLHTAVLRGDISKVVRLAKTKKARNLLLAKNLQGLTPQQLAFQQATQIPHNPSYNQIFSTLFYARQELFNPPQKRSFKRKGREMPHTSKRQKLHHLLVNEIKEMAYISEVRAYISKLIESGTHPTQILVILDLDGTITNDREPCEDNEEAEFRIDADFLLLECFAKGVEFIITSAGADPQRSVNTLIKLEQSAMFNGEALQLVDIGYGQRQFEGYAIGRVVGLREKGQKYYRLKALAPRLFYKPEQLLSFKHVVFADDSKLNVVPFIEEIGNLGLSPNTVVQAFYLCPPEEFELRI